MRALSQPTVSVIVPTFNNERLLPRALDSVIAQTFDDWEIVLIDDGSTDGTAGVATHYADRLGERFVYVHQPNGGSSAARNRGIDISRGRFVAFLDADDEFRPIKLERQMALFDLRPELGLVYSDYAFVDLDGVRHESAFDSTHPTARQVPTKTVGPRLHVCTARLFDILLRAYFISTIVGLIRREVLGASIRFSVGQIFGEEWLFYLKVVKGCRTGFVDEPLSIYHYRRGSLARSDKARNAAHYRDLLKTMETSLGDLSHRERRIIAGNVARLDRQLGYQAYRSGHYARAAELLGEAWKYERGARTLYHLCRAWIRQVFLRSSVHTGRKQCRDDFSGVAP